MNVVVGVDPGVRGGIAVLGVDGSVRQVYALNPTMLEVQLDVLLLNVQMACHDQTWAFVEKVQYIGGSGARCPTCGHRKGGDGGTGSHTFGYIKGFLRGELRARGFLICDIYPMIWQSALGCMSGGNKNVTKARAQQLFPGVKVTHAIADSLLIAEYGRRQLLSRESAESK